MKTKSLVILLLITILTICSCKLEPELSGEAETIATVGIRAETAITEAYFEDGSYAGLVVNVYDNSVYLNFSNASIELDLSELSLGMQSVVVNGQVVISYDNPPATYPATQTINISFTYGGSRHTLEAKVRMTGVSSGKITGIKVDGKQYKDQSI